MKRSKNAPSYDPQDRLGAILALKQNRLESQVLNAVCQYLSAKGYFFWRQNNTGVYRTIRDDAQRIEYWMGY